MLVNRISKGDGGVERQPYVFCRYDGHLPQGCAPEVHVMQRVLMLRGLVLTPEQDIHSWLQFASLCRVNKNFRISKKVRMMSLTCPDPCSRRT